MPQRAPVAIIILYSLFINLSISNYILGAVDVKQTCNAAACARFQQEAYPG
jgi:hypothetical protein